MSQHNGKNRNTFVFFIYFDLAIRGYTWLYAYSRIRIASFHTNFWYCSPADQLYVIVYVRAHAHQTEVSYHIIMYLIIIIRTYTYTYVQIIICSSLECIVNLCCHPDRIPKLFGNTCRYRSQCLTVDGALNSVCMDSELCASLRAKPSVRTT